MMPRRVRSLRLVPQPEQRRRKVVNILKEYLGRARRGEIDSITLFAELRGEGEPFEVRGTVSEDLYATIGKLEMVKFMRIPKGE